MASETEPQASTSKEGQGDEISERPPQILLQQKQQLLATPSLAQQRVHFLYNSAVQVSMQGKSLNDGFAKLARKYAAILREVRNVERPKIAAEVSRTFCKKCREVFIARIPKVECAMIQKRVLQRRCLTCGHTKNFQISPNYIPKKQRLADEE